MSYARYLPDAELVKVMSNAFDAHLRTRLRERIIAAIEPELNAAIDDAMKTFERTVQLHRDVSMNEAVVRVILSDKRSTA